MYEPYMEHSGIKGMHWGIRRYQNTDGSLTPAGRARYGVGPARKVKTTVGKVIKGISKTASGAGRSVKSSTKAIAKKIRTNAEVRKDRSFEKAVSSGNVNKLIKNLDRMSDKELNDALNRARQVKALKDLKAPKKSLTDQIGDVATTATKIATAVKKASEARSERLKYRQAKEAYDRDEDERYEQERKQWEQDHANDPKISDSLKNALRNAKDLGSRARQKLDNWEPYDTSGSQNPKPTPKHPTNTKDLSDIGSDLKNALRNAKDLGSRARQRLDDWEPYNTSGSRKPTSDSHGSKSSYDDIDDLIRDMTEKNKRKLRKLGYM